MSLSVFEYGDGRFRLFRDGSEIGWVEGRAVGFVGFDSEAAAVRAALAAYNALSDWVARQCREQVTPRRRLGLRVEDGEHHRTVDGIAIGRLLSEPVDRTPSGVSHGFELKLPPRIGAALSAAQVIDQALVRHRKLRELESASAIGTTEVGI
jgi:hypothetical protein